MRILVVHNQGRLIGGADAVFSHGSRLLAQRGHEVALLTATPLYPPSGLSHTVYSLTGLETKNFLTRKWDQISGFTFSGQARKLARKAIDEFRPDIIHLHIIQGGLSPSILKPFKDRGIPVVQTLHDYLLLCPVNSFLSNGQICEACCSKRYVWAALKRCRHHSWIRSIAFSAGAYLSDCAYGYDDLITRYITPGDFLRQKMVENGYPSEKLILLHNSFFGPAQSANPSTRKHILYAGRLILEKGVDLLIKAAQGLDVPVLIAGDGPERPHLEDLTQKIKAGNVFFLGQQPQEVLANLYRSALALVFPSRWYENAPLVIFEAYANGTPVIGARIGAIPEFIEEGRTGYLFKANDAGDLHSFLQRGLADRQNLKLMGDTARELVQTRYSPEKYAEGLEKIFGAILNGRIRS